MMLAALALIKAHVSEFYTGELVTSIKEADNFLDALKKVEKL